MLASRLLTGASEEIVAPEQQVVRRQPRLSDDYKRQDWLRALLQFSTSRVSSEELNESFGRTGGRNTNRLDDSRLRRRGRIRVLPAFLSPAAIPVTSLSKAISQAVRWHTPISPTIERPRTRLDTRPNRVHLALRHQSCPPRRVQTRVVIGAVLAAARCGIRLVEHTS